MDTSHEKKTLEIARQFFPKFEWTGGICDYTHGLRICAAAFVRGEQFRYMVLLDHTDAETTEPAASEAFQMLAARRIAQVARGVMLAQERCMFDTLARDTATP